jgi:hypothetical protein
MTTSFEETEFGKRNDENNKIPWGVLRKHRLFIALFLIGGLIAFIGAIIVLRWYVGTSEIGGQGTWSIDLFSVGSIVKWVIFLILYEIGIIGIPTAIILGGLAIWRWLTLPQEEKKQFGSGKPTKGATGSGCFSTLILILFLLIIFLQGKWFTLLGDLPYSYFVITYLVACLIIAVPFVLVGLAWFFYKIMK